MDVPAWHLTPYMLPLVVAAAVSLAQTGYSWRRRETPGALPLGALLLSMAFWSLTYAVELGGTDLDTQLFWNKVMFTGVVAVPPAWLVFSLRHTGRAWLTSRRSLSLLAIQPALMLAAVWTDTYHHLVWINPMLEWDQGLPWLTSAGHGWVFWAHTAYCYVVLLLANGLVVQRLARSRHLYRRQSVMLVLAGLVPWLGNAATVFNWSPIPTLDLTPLAFTAAGLLFAWAVFHLRVLDMVPVARELVFEGMGDAAIVLDASGHVVDLNPAGEHLLGCSAATVIGQNSAELFAAHPLGVAVGNQPDMVREYVAGESMHTEVSVIVEGGEERSFDLRVFPMHRAQNELAGRLIIVRDVTERTRLVAQQTARRSEARFRALVQHSSDVIAIVDLAGAIGYHSPAITRVFGYQPDELTGTCLHDLIHPADQPRVLAMLEELAARPGETISIEWRLRHHDGTWREVEAITTNLLAEPDVAGIVLNLRDITERKALQEQLARQAFQDPLTGLGNRVLFRDRLERALARAQREASSSAVLFVDLDNFKTINDSLGHAAGDQLLLTVAERLQSSLRAVDTAARFGGDEFALLLEKLDQPEDAEHVARRIGERLRAPIDINGTEVFVGLSIGIVVAGPQGSTADELLRDADVAMYMAKARGKGCSVRFEPSMHAAASARLQLEADLRRAVERHEFVVHYQPVVDLRSETLAGWEALVRWQHPERGLLGPDTFVRLAEETGMVVPLGRWVLEQACRQLRLWQDRYPSETPLSMSVNVSGRQFHEPSLIDDVARILGDNDLDPTCLTLELTESVLLENVEATIEQLQRLRRLGVRLAIDDFGTGYSSLSYLRTFPVDILKVDRSFVDASDADRGVLLQTILNLGQLLGLQTVGEGIERPEQRDRLRRLGCDFGQGYYFARPASAHEIETIARTRETNEDLLTEAA